MKSFRNMQEICGHSPILSCVVKIVDLCPDKVALICGSETVTYRQLVQRIFSAAAALQQLGIGKGDIVSLSATKGLEFIYLYFAVHVIGAIVVVVDPESNQKKMEYMMQLTKPSLCIGMGWCNYRAIPYDAVSLLSDATPKFVDGLKDSDTADIVFTTGTTGNPKGVLLSHFNIFSSADNINSFIKNTSEEVEILGLPLCHSFGLGRLRCTLIKGATMVVLPGFANIKMFFSAIENYHATGFGMVPAVWAYIRKFSGTRIARYASQIKYIEIGSAAMPLASKEELCELFPDTRICHHYGLTEASRNCFMEYHESRSDLNTIGREVCDKVSIKILGDDGREVPVGAAGEICVKGNMVMKGYFLTEETSNAFWGDYFRTGDEGYRAANGNLYLVSRKKEMINIGGKKASPIEIEDAIISLGVQDCAVVGVADPGGILGEVPKAFILREGCGLTFDAIKEALVGKLESYKVPVAFEWVDEIPRTASGKKQRLQLKK